MTCYVGLSLCLNRPKKKEKKLLHLYITPIAMATGSDVRDILDLEDQPTNLSRREVLFGAVKPKRKSNAKPLVKKPEGLSREVWGLLYSDSRDPPRSTRIRTRVAARWTAVRRPFSASPFAAA